MNDYGIIVHEMNLEKHRVSRVAARGVTPIELLVTEN